MIVRENINFERGEDPKKTMGLGVYVPGRLFKYKDNFGSRQNYPNVYILVESQDKKFRTYFYIGRFIEPQHSLFGQEFSFSGKLESENSWNVSPIKYDKFEPISPDEQRRLNKIFSDPENESMISKIARITNVRPILRESIDFQRGGEETDIKNKLFGFRPGQIIKRQLPNDPNNKELFVFISRETSKGPTKYPFILKIGVLRPAQAVKNTEGGYDIKRPGRALLNSNYSPVLSSDMFLQHLDPEERKLVQEALDDPENKIHLEKITEIITSDITPFV
jgi:hypothetical protein